MKWKMTPAILINAIVRLIDTYDLTSEEKCQLFHQTGEKMLELFYKADESVQDLHESAVQDLMKQFKKS